MIEKRLRQPTRIQSGSLLAQSNCAIFCLKATLAEGFRKKAIQSDSNQIKENGALFGALFGALPLGRLEYQFIEQYYTFLLVQKRVTENTAMKYAQGIKEIIDRSVSKGWISSNPFGLFKCRYTDPKHDWLTMQEFQSLHEYQFSNEKLNIIKDVFLFSSFTGLSYQEVYTLHPADIITGIDGNKWINKNRQKTGADETLPILPLPLQIIDKYKNHPVSAKRGKILPLPTNQKYNRCLKVL